MSLRKLIYRKGAIGDIVHCLPALQLLRRREPDTRIDMIVGSSELASMLEAGAPYIDHVYVSSPKLKDTIGLEASLREDPIDEFIYLHSNFWKAHYWQQTFIKARRITTYRKDTNLGARENFAWTLFPDLREQLLAKQYSKEIFSILDYKCLEAVPRLTPRPYLCLVPGVGGHRPTRAYPLDYWLELIAELLRKTDLDIYILGGPDEEHLAHELFIALTAESKSLRAEYERKDLTSPNPAPEERLVNMIGKTSLVELLSILAGSRLVLAGDTGLLHIASALGRPSVSVYTVTSELRTGPHSPLATVLRSHSCACNPSFCNKGNEQKHCSQISKGYASCVWDITSAELAQKCYDGLKARC